MGARRATRKRGPMLKSLSFLGRTVAAYRRGARQFVGVFASSRSKRGIDRTIDRVWEGLSAHPREAGVAFERIVETFFDKVVEPGDVVIDGGAHSGHHTVPLARLV